jgi:hypothetical protein
MFKIKLKLSKLSTYEIIALILSLTAIIATYIRLYFGVDFIDESYYVTLAYQYSLGAKPFVDDISPLLFGILTLPFIKLYCWLVGSTDGIILFARNLYFAFNLLAASFVLLAIKNLVKWSTALLISLTCVVFIPFNIPNLSYNTLGSGFFTSGCFLGTWIILNRKNPAYLFFAGICHSLAIFSYPILLLPSIIFLGIIFFLIDDIKKNRALLGYLLGGIPISLLVIKLILDAGLEKVLISLKYARSLGYLSGWDKFSSILKALWIFYPYKVPLLLFSIGLYFLIKKYKTSNLANVFLLFPLIPVPIAYSGYIQHCGCIFSMGYLFYYSLLSPYLLLFSYRHDKKLRIIFWVGWIPSFMAGLLTAYNSGNGYANAGLLMVGASIVTTIFLIKQCNNLLQNQKNIREDNRELIAPLILVFILSFSQYSLPGVHHIIYLDADIQNLNSKIDEGPFAGLYTTQEKKDYLTELSSQLKAVARPDEKVVFYHNNFPAGYLITSMRSAINVSFWGDPKYYTGEVRKLIISYLRKQLEENNVIAVKMERLLLWEYTSRKNPENDFVSQIIVESTPVKIVDSENFQIYRLNPEN